MREASSPPSSLSAEGIRGSRAERVRPQKRWGDRSFRVAENFQPMWEPQVRHCAMVQAYLPGRGRATLTRATPLHVYILTPLLPLRESGGITRTPFNVGYTVTPFFYRNLSRSECRHIPTQPGKSNNPMF